jgi:predicted dehydrogenase
MGNSALDGARTDENEPGPRRVTKPGTKPLKLGIAGLSTAATWVLRESLALPFIQVRAAADHRVDALDRFRTELDAQVFDDIEEMCRKADVDAVLIGTPPAARAEHAIIAAGAGKHVIVEKPMALSVDEAERMNAAAEAAGVQLLCGHTHNFDPPIRKMAEIVQSGTLGPLCMINTWNFNEFIYRPNSAQDLSLSHGLMLNQGIHQVDLVRLIGGGMVKSVRATVGRWAPTRPFESGYTCHVSFESGAAASLVYGGAGFFDVAELVWGIAESGGARDFETGMRARTAFGNLDPVHREATLEGMKDGVRYGAEGLKSGPTHANWPGPRPAASPAKHQPFFGLTIASCERGDIRQSPDGLFVYGEKGKTEIPVEFGLSQRQLELFELYDALTNGRSVAHGGRWGEASLEMCLAMLDSAAQQREVALSHQVREAAFR